MNKITFIDLFAGIGGMHQGLNEAAEKYNKKVECLFYSEIDKYSIQTYEKNFPNLLNLGDITKIDNKELKKYKNKTDIITAGFPCQPFSNAGKKKAFSDNRGILFFDIIRIANQINPKFILLENVRHLLSIEGGKVIEKILSELQKKYYIYGPKILNSKDFGVPQNRKRVFILASKKKINFQFPEPLNKKTNVLKILDKTKNIDKYIISKKLWDGHRERKIRNKDRGVGFGYGLVDEQSQHTNTLSARYYKDGGEILVKTRNIIRPRKLTPRECARLQGFSNKFKIPVSDVQAYKQFGNSVTVKVINQIFTNLFLTL